MDGTHSNASMCWQNHIPEVDQAKKCCGLLPNNLFLRWLGCSICLSNLHMLGVVGWLSSSSIVMREIKSYSASKDLHSPFWVEWCSPCSTSVVRLSTQFISFWDSPWASVVYWGLWVHSGMTAALGEYFGNRVGEIMDTLAKIEQLIQSTVLLVHVRSQDNAADRATMLRLNN